MPIQDVALKTYRKRWTIEKDGGKDSQISVLMSRHNDEEIVAKFSSFLLMRNISMIQLKLTLVSVSML